MEISGIRIHVTVAGRELLRVPRWWVESERHTPLGRAGVTLPDPDGELAQSVKIGDMLEISLGYRDHAPTIWQGTITGTTPGATNDQLELQAADGALPLTTALICQSWIDEAPEAIIAWCVRQAGLPVGRLDAPGCILPRFAAATIPVWQVARSATQSCQRSFDIDLRRWALWLGRDGINWGDFDEPGDVPIIATAANLITHQPAEETNGLSVVETFLLPDLSHSRRVRVQDVKRGVDITVRALRVRHQGAPDSARTIIWYGVEYGRI